MKRRDAINNMLIGMGGISIGTQLLGNKTLAGHNGNVNHSVCRWCYGGIPWEEFIEGIKGIDGLKSVELTTVEEWPMLIKNGLTCALGTGPFANIVEGFNDPGNHDKLIQPYLGLIDNAAEYGIPSIIVFSGNRNGMDDETGLENCAVGLEKVVRHAEKKGVTVVMELLNSKVDHKDYMCDHTAWGVKLAEKIGSDRFKLLYDIYHMQIMEGDVIRTIKDNHQYIAHYHTGGNPGRNEIDETQELFYPAIMRAIVETGYDGWVAQEFIPTWDDKMKALNHGVRTCDV
ncbi:hydroxypyruvate isomerase family protein [Portibacter marinus]|uniref:hydroxypyruvate isomerase family protein n=1 Tax=Portibacter marinus TaxID=2898660 RepID=UPI001F36AF8F|nr:TIM barrel protein [Portibacter marinus]